jgi:hypothetical protein
MTGSKSAFTMQKRTTLSTNPDYVSYLKKKFMKQHLKRGGKSDDGNQVSQSLIGV